MDNISTDRSWVSKAYEIFKEIDLEASQSLVPFDEFMPEISLPSTINNLSKAFKDRYEKRCKNFKEKAELNKSIRFCFYLLEYQKTYGNLLEKEMPTFTKKPNTNKDFWIYWSSDSYCGALIEALSSTSLNRFNVDEFYSESEVEHYRISEKLLTAFSLYYLSTADVFFKQKNQEDFLNSMQNLVELEFDIGLNCGWAGSVESESDSRKGIAKEAGRQRHAQSPISDCKKIALELSNKWIKKPSTYVSQVEFAKDVVEKSQIENLTKTPNEEVIKRWHRANVLVQKALNKAG
jgi:hypothetical protein